VTAEQEALAATLMTRAQQGDGLAYGELLTMLTIAGRQYVRSKLGDAPCSDDVVQETLLSVHRARATYDPRRPFAPWFYAILSNRVIDSVRRERRIAAREVKPEILPEPAAARESGHDEPRIDAARITSALSALPPRQREIVSSLKLQGESVRQVGARMGMTESAVKVAAHRGYKALRRLLGKDE
jgi:RNA polymerase sigma-70 factor (ECF subfamily)